LENIAVVNGGTLNLFAKVSNVSDITLDGGTVQIGSSPAGAFDGVISQIAKKLEYTDPATGKIYKGSEGNIVIETADYPWKGDGTKSSPWTDTSLESWKNNGVGTLVIGDGKFVKISHGPQTPSLYVSSGGTLQLNSGGNMAITLENNDGHHEIIGTAVGLGGTGRMELSQSFVINLITEGDPESINAVLLRCRDGVPEFSGIHGVNFAKGYNTYRAFSERLCNIQLNGEPLDIAEKFGTSLLVDYDSGELRIDSAMKYIPYAPRKTTLHCAPGSRVVFTDWRVKDGVAEEVEAIDAGGGTDENPLAGGGALCGIDADGVAVQVAAGDGEPVELHFANNPNFPTKILDAAGNPIMAHMYATNATNDETAVGVRLNPGANATICVDTEGAQAKFRPTIVAHSDVNAGEGNVNGAAIGLQTDQDSVITINAPVSIRGKSSATTSGENTHAYSTAIGLGPDAVAEVTDEESEDTGENAPAPGNIAATFGDGNALSATSDAAASVGYTDAFSSAVGLGAAAGSDEENENIFARDIMATFGDGNTLNATSGATATDGDNTSARSAASGLGMAIGEVNECDTGNMAIIFGDGNVLSASSGVVADTSADARSSAVGLGIAVGFAGEGSEAFSSDIVAVFGDGNALNAYSGVTANIADGEKDIDACSTAAGLGMAAGETSGSTFGGIVVTFGDGNALSASSGVTTSFPVVEAHSSAVGLGIAVGFAGEGSKAFSSDIVATFGANGVLSAASIAAATSENEDVFAYSAATGLGAAVAIDPDNEAAGSMTWNVTANFNGSQLVSALAYSTGADGANPKNVSVNAFGADQTDVRRYDDYYDTIPEGHSVGDIAEGAYGWRVGIFAAGEDIVEGEKTVADAVTGDSTVNILGAKMGANVAFPEEGSNTGKAVITLGEDQGDSYSNYARAFAIGENFEIYIGGRADPETHSFTPVAPALGTTNVVNILGAIARGRMSDNTDGSSLAAGSGWTVNAYGPLNDLEDITVANGSTLNLFNGASDVGEISLNGGTLRIGSSPAGAFDGVISQIAERLEYTNPATGKIYKGSEGNIVIDGANYPWKGNGGEVSLHALKIGTATSSTLELSKGGTLVANVKHVMGVGYSLDGDPLNLGNNGTFRLSGGAIRLSLADDAWTNDAIAIDVATGNIRLTGSGPEATIGGVRYRYVPSIAAVSDNGNLPGADT
jgi:hypothetical protein